MRVPYANMAAQHVPIKKELLQAFGEVIDQGHFILSEKVEEFERRFAAACGVRFAVGVNSGTDALILALKALSIGPGDEVITVPNSFVATASSIALSGARPVFVDVGNDYNMDPSMLARAITPRTKAILPVHLTGRPANMDAILEVARIHNLHVVEDCAQAVLAEYRGKPVGSFGVFGCFSLHPLKTLNACGDGGVVVMQDEELYRKVKILRNVGLVNRDECIVWSAHSRLDSLQAAALLVKLNYVAAWTEKRRANAEYYQGALDGVAGLRLPVDQPYEKAVYHVFVVQAERRNELRKFLAEKGVETAIHYPIPIHLQEVAKCLGYGPGSFPTAEEQANRILSLPIYPELGRDALDYVASKIREFYDVY